MENSGIYILDKKVYFIVVACTGDNKGVNSLLGFTECFVANYYCRFCKMHREESKQTCHEDSTLLRTERNYREALEKNDVSATGIVNDCIFNQLQMFTANENYAVDIMHDIFEGVLNIELGLILKHFIYVKNYFSLKNLNNRINVFDFGQTEGLNKPQ